MHPTDPRERVDVDLSRTMSMRPSGSGIALALAGGSGAVIHDLAQFARELTENGLVETADVESLKEQIMVREGPRDAAALARELVRYSRLTPYQAAAVLQGKTKGLLIGNYVVLEKLGAGSMGIVFKARNRVLKRLVALKLLPPSLARDQSAVSRFQREAKAAAKLSHPNVVAVLDADEFRGLHFLVMEYVEGRDLARLVREQGPLSITRAIDCIVQAARGLEAAFGAAVVHRDIKPSNLLLEPGGTVKILDMGLARLYAVGGPFGANQPDASLTQSNVLLGTIDYMSPEQATNPRNADHRSDIYSLGCTLHYLLTGRPPYSGETLMERLIAHREHPIPCLSDRVPEIPAALDVLLRRVLAKSPGDRFSSFDELIAGLEACRPGVGPEMNEPPAQPIGLDPPESNRKPRPVIASCIAGIAAVAGLIITGTYLSRREPVGVGHEHRPAAVPPALAAPDAVLKPKSAASEPRGSSLAGDQPKPIATFAQAGNPPANSPIIHEVVGLVRELKGHDRRVNGIAVSSDGLLALSGGHDRTVRLWNVATGAELRRVDHDGPVNAVAMTADGRHGLSGSADRTVKLWDFQSEHNVGARRLEGHTAAVFAVAFALGEQLAVSGGADRALRAWDVTTGQAFGSPLLHESAVVAVAPTGNDGVLAGCEDGTIWLWDLTTRQRVRRLKAPGPVLCVAGTPLGNRALSGHPDGVLVLWDLDLGAEIGRMAGHNDLVRCAALLPDGHRALAGSQFGNLILWDVDARRELRRFYPAVGASERVGQLGIAVFADLLHALTADTDATVRLWRLPASNASPEAAGKRPVPSITRPTSRPGEK
jgi:eukaryotic-like serine/threonine-protein kinase